VYPLLESSDAHHELQEFKPPVGFTGLCIWLVCYRLHALPLLLLIR
jgi:hypothetical protein